MDWVIYALLGVIAVGIVALLFIVMKNSSRLSRFEERQHEIDKLKARIIDRTDEDINIEIMRREVTATRQENSRLQHELYNARLESQRARDMAELVTKNTAKDQNQNEE